MDRDAIKKAQQASRTAFLKKQSKLQSKTSSAVLEERIKDIEQGVVPQSLVEADFLLKRAEQVRAAQGLLQTATHRHEMADNTAIQSTKDLPSLSGDTVFGDRLGISEDVLPPYTRDVKDGAGSDAVGSGFVAMDSETIERRVKAHEYVPEKSIDEIERDRVASLQQRHELLQAQRRSLPIYGVRAELLQLIKDNQVVVLVGETGSGKSTQLLQYLYEEGFHLLSRTERRSTEAVSRPDPENSAKEDRGDEDEAEDDDEGDELRLICTQPRRIAAMSVAERVAQEVGCSCGSVVGYRVRFDDRSSSLTRILFVTDGMMLNEFTKDPNLESVAAIMIDEAHERSLSTDILLGLLRDVVRRNPHIRVIVASATINAEKFSNFFNKAPILNVKGRTFAVDVFYVDVPITDYVSESAQTALSLHLTKPLPGDILIFLPGQDAIESCAEILRQNLAESQGTMRPLLILPIYSAMPPKEQARIYTPTPPGARKVVIATNIAETSITIDGIVYVVDCGLCKQDYYNARAMVEELRVVPTSQASAQQRAGRAGRTQRGECFRLYTPYTFRNELLEETTPEILRASMSAVVLQLKAIGVDNLLQFDFVDPPSTESLERALDQLYLLGAMKADGRLTVTGRRMSEFPLEPPLSKALLRACGLRCGRHMAMAAAMLSIDSIFLTSRDPQERQLVESAKGELFAFGNGDVAGYVRVMEEWLRAGPQAGEFCRVHGIHPRSLLRARDVLDQILKIYDRIGLDLKEDDSNERHPTTLAAPEARGATEGLYPSGRMINTEALTKALLSGFFFNVAKMGLDKRTYTIVRPIHTGGSSYGASLDDDACTTEIHPNSFLFRSGMKALPNKGLAAMMQSKETSNGADVDLRIPQVLRERPSLVVFTQLRRTTKRYMMHLTAIESVDMILEMSPLNYFTREELETKMRKRLRE
ncbi:unnamed protein product [Phytomonas sp. EM1]|nr:unnamed protein product [Phytomonas sp. EM1]|eukprot:CCW59972.1 unnamed protein product [Phytomonas sp. isolate EM1]